MTIPSTNEPKTACQGVIPAILTCLLLAGCSATVLQPAQSEPPPPEPPDLGARVAELDARQAELEKAAANLQSEQATFTAREQRIAATEKALAQRQQQLAKLEKAAQEAQFRAQLQPTPSRVAAPGFLVLGELEHIFLEPPGVTLSARVDTGSEISSLHALDVTEFERDGKPYVNFSIADPKTGEAVQLTRRVRDHVRIREANGKSVKRPTVLLRAVLGEIDERILFSLVDRSKNSNPVLIGRNLLRDLAIVDVSKQYVTSPANK